MERGVHFAELPQKIIAVLPLRLPLNATFKQMKTQFVDIMFFRLPPKHYSPASLPLQSNGNQALKGLHLGPLEWIKLSINDCKMM